MRRRSFLAGMTGLGAATAAGPVWAEVGAPDFLTAASLGEKTFLLGLSASGAVRFAIPLPARGHAAAAHPRRAEAVAFARRPGTFALVIDCTTGAVLSRLSSPSGRHFYGHGAYTADGAYLLTTENDYDAPDGRIGVWDVVKGYARIDDLPSGGIGPHEILRLASGGFAVANGGIQTHPSRARARLNLPDMHSNLTFLDETGAPYHTVWAPEEMRQNSIRHIESDGTGRVIAALQWQGDPRQEVSLLAIIADNAITYHAHPETSRLKQYGGSVTATRDGEQIVVTGPKGGYAAFFDGSGAPRGGRALALASGAAPVGPTGLTLTYADGLWSDDGTSVPVAGGYVFDNHLIPVGTNA